MLKMHGNYMKFTKIYVKTQQKYLNLIKKLKKVGAGSTQFSDFWRWGWASFRVFRNEIASRSGFSGTRSLAVPDFPEQDRWSFRIFRNAEVHRGLPFQIFRNGTN